MFTGIITGIGTLREAQPAHEGADARFVIAAPERNASWADMAAIALGASICCSGCCLTVVERGAGHFSVDVSAETLSKTILGSWKPGTPVNLEAALRLGDELGGHIVSGHVDGTGELIARTPENGSTRLRFLAPEALARFIAPKGSIAINGVSLTVNEVEGAAFGVNIIPHTETATTLGVLGVGDRVNLEIDMLARYVARLAEFK
jgi:riboflavin synthase